MNWFEARLNTVPFGVAGAISTLKIAIGPSDPPPARDAKKAGSVSNGWVPVSDKPDCKFWEEPRKSIAPAPLLKVANSVTVDPAEAT